MVVDTCIWASFFRKPLSPEKRAVDELIDQDRVVLIGPIITEVLRGFRKQREADFAVSALRAAHCPDVIWEDWRKAADLGRELAALGHKVPVTDLVIGAVAVRQNFCVYTSDPHFDLIPDLKRFAA